MPNPRPPAHTFVSFAALALLLSGALLYAGPLDPPPGPITSTGKTLTEVEPRIAISAANTPGDADSLFKITQRGSYYLTGNITGVVGKHGIEIASSGVTLDLNGFDLVGVPAMGNFDGVSVTVGSLTNIAVVNGSVRNWGGAGVELPSSNAANGRIEGVLASGNASHGIVVGFGMVVSNCSAASNGLNGIATSTGCTVSNCSAYLNTSSGISVGLGGAVSNCTAYQNSGHGLSIGSGGTVTSSAGYQNTVSGINTGSGVVVVGCTAYDNAANGISVGIGSTVEGCTAGSNTLNGITCTAACAIRGNTCSSNGNGGDGAGIHATSNDNRIEGNNCIAADRGIDVDAAGNYIIRNTCSGNTTNWDIAIGNSLGPIVVAGTNAVVISGNGPVASTLNSTDPHANFSY